MQFWFWFEIKSHKTFRSPINGAGQMAWDRRAKPSKLLIAPTKHGIPL